MIEIAALDDSDDDDDDDDDDTFNIDSLELIDTSDRVFDLERRLCFSARRVISTTIHCSSNRLRKTAIVDISNNAIAPTVIPAISPGELLVFEPFEFESGPSDGEGGGAKELVEGEAVGEGSELIEQSSPE